MKQALLGLLVVSAWSAAGAGIAILFGRPLLAMALATQAAVCAAAAFALYRDLPEAP